jgi:hypothetical protein
MRLKPLSHFFHGYFGRGPLYGLLTSPSDHYREGGSVKAVKEIWRGGAGMTIVQLYNEIGPKEKGMRWDLTSGISSYASMNKETLAGKPKGTVVSLVAIVVVCWSRA